MPNINWPKVPDATDFTPIPEGKYPVLVTKVEGGTTKTNNDEMWTMELTVCAGEFIGRKFTDRLVFSEKGVGRIKRALKAMGLDVTVEANYSPVDILDKKFVADVIIDEQTVRKPGQEPKTYQNNKVSFAGFYSIDTVAVEIGDDDPLPF